MMERSSGCKLISYGAAMILRLTACLRRRDYIAQAGRQTQKYEARRELVMSEIER